MCYGNFLEIQLNLHHILQNRPSGFCRISEVREWIDSIISGAKFCPNGPNATTTEKTTTSSKKPIPTTTTEKATTTKDPTISTKEATTTATTKDLTTTVTGCKCGFERPGNKIVGGTEISPVSFTDPTQRFCFIIKCVFR